MFVWIFKPHSNLWGICNQVLGFNFDCELPLHCHPCFVIQHTYIQGDILLVADEFDDGWKRGLRLCDLEVMHSSTFLI